MVPTVAGEFVPAGNDAANERRVAFCDPAQREKGRLDPRRIENLEQTVDIAFDSAGQSVPVAAIDSLGESLNLEIVLDIDRHRVDQHRRYRAHKRRSGTAGGWPHSNLTLSILPRLVGKPRHSPSLSMRAAISASARFMA